MKNFTNAVLASCFVATSIYTHVQAGELSAGIASISVKSPFKGEGTKTLPLPAIKYETENFHYFLDSAAYTLISHKSNAFFWGVSGVAKLRYLYRAQEDNLAGMEDRDASLDAGLTFKTKAPWGNLGLTFIADATSKHNGSETSIAYSYDHMVTNQLIFTPSATISHYSKNLADYNYGVRASEAIAVTRTEYHPDDATIGKYSLTFIYLLSNHWMLLQTTSLTDLDDTLTKSPIVIEDKETQVFFGALYKFD